MKALIISFLVMLAAIPAQAQQRPPNDVPGAPHAALRGFVGEWEGMGRMWRSPDSSVPPLEAQVFLSSEMVMGGRYLVEKITSQAGSRPFEQVRVVTYDNLTRRYEGVTYDNFGTGFIRAVGEMNPAGELVMTYIYTDVGTSASVTRRTVRKFISEDEWVETAFETSGGPERQVTEIRARRKR